MGRDGFVLKVAAATISIALMADFRLFSWNIRQGGGTRVTAIVETITKANAHVLVLSEYRNNPRGEEIIRRLKSAGFSQFQTTDSAANENSVIIASRLPFQAQGFSDRVVAYPHAMICAEFSAFDVYGMYLPHKKKHTWFDVILDRIALDKPCILTGDFNTGKNFIDQSKNSFWYTEKLEAIEEIGYVDAFRHMHGDVREYSWYSHQGNGYRYDHTYVHPAIAPLISDCRYDHESRQANHSDHSPMILDLEIT
jgi:exonuclease III